MKMSLANNSYALVLLTGCWALFNHALAESTSEPTIQAVETNKTVADIIDAVGFAARSRLVPYFFEANTRYPPQQITLLAIKRSATLELWAGPKSHPAHIRTYAIKALSGNSGPKLYEGDKQVPEGIYRIEALNPNSNFHLSLKLNYPNAYDLIHAREEQRNRPGSNIFIHGKSDSIGCLAMGDKAVEELFVLAADTGIENIKIVIAPTDPRKNQLTTTDSRIWVADLYSSITREFAWFAGGDRAP